MEYKDVYTLKVNDKDHLISAQEATQLSSIFVQAEKEYYVQEFLNPLIKNAIKRKRKIVHFVFHELKDFSKINFNPWEVASMLENYGYETHFSEGTCWFKWE